MPPRPPAGVPGPELRLSRSALGLGQQILFVFLNRRVGRSQGHRLPRRRRRTVRPRVMSDSRGCLWSFYFQAALPSQPAVHSWLSLGGGRGGGKQVSWVFSCRSFPSPGMRTLGTLLFKGWLHTVSLK